MTAYQGKSVVYTLSESDVIAINAKRDQTGVRGNPVGVGDVCGAFIAKLWNPTYANLAVSLDGNDTYWATSKTTGTGPGCWYDPNDTAPAPEPVAQPEAAPVDQPAQPAPVDDQAPAVPSE